MKRKPLIILIILILLNTTISAVPGTTDTTPGRNSVGIGPNLAPNPSFEDGDTMPTGWTFSPNSTGIFHWDSDYAHSGEKSVGVLNLTHYTQEDLKWITTDFIPVDFKMNTYIFSVWARSVGTLPWGQFVILFYRTYDENYHSIGGQGSGGSISKNWDNISIDTTYDHEEAVKYVKLEVGQDGVSGYELDPLVEVRFDDVYFGVLNTVPDIPTIIGETKGRARTLYEYMITTIDPNQDDIKYEIDWGDNTTTITHLYESGEKINISHIWGIEGTYIIKVKAVDVYGAESDWGTLTITMPLSYKPPYFRFFEWLFGRFPNACPILRYLFGSIP